MTGNKRVKELFDRKLLRERRTRALKKGQRADFLFQEAASEINNRLAMVNRVFDLTLDLGNQIGKSEKTGQVIGMDSCIEMLEPGADCIAGDEEALPFGAKAFDLVTSTLQLHWANDLPGALIQINKALKPDGLFLGALLGGGTLSELRLSLLSGEEECEGGASVRVSPFASVQDMGGLMQRAGFALPVIDRDVLTVRYADPISLMRDLRAMGWANVLHARSRKPLARKTLNRALDIYKERFSDEDGRITASFEIIYLSGWSPDESQPKPLRPGSAQISLTEVLGKTQSD